MTTKFLTIKFAKFPNFPQKLYCHGVSQEKQCFGQFPSIFPLPNPLQNANSVNTVRTDMITI